MCGRYRLTTTPAELGRRFSAHVHNDLQSQRPRFNVAPTDIMPVLRVVDDERWLMPHRWGLIQHWATDPKIGSTMINARAETLFEKPAFKDALLHRRCLVVVDGVYEWKTLGPRQKLPYLITFNDEQPVTLAGLWSIKRSDTGPIFTFTILTTAANETLRVLHHRMPVVVGENDRDGWLDPALETVDLARLASSRELPGVRLRAVSSRLGNVRNDDESLLVADEEAVPDFSTSTTNSSAKKPPVAKKSAPKNRPDQGNLF